MGGNSSKEFFCCNHNNSLKNADISIKNKTESEQLSKIQANFRGYLFRKKNHSLLSNFNTNNSSSITDLTKQIKEIPMSYSTEVQDNNPKIIKLKALLPKFEINEKEKYLLNISQELKPMALLYPGNSIYKGTVNSRFQKEGYGKLYLPDGSIYEGFFKENKMEGRGRLTNIEGFVYDGEFKNGQANGYGKYLKLDGTIYKGNWINEKLNGICEICNSDNSMYIGNFVNGKKNGRGKFIFPEGNFYEGFFSDDNINGEGYFKYRDGRIFIGNWKNNKMNGYGIFIWPDKKKYYGNYINNNKNGFGIFYWIDGKKYVGFWSEGKQHGYGYIETIDGKEYGEWYEGKHIKSMNSEKEINIIDKCINFVQNDNDYVLFKYNIERYEKNIGIINNNNKIANINNNYIVGNNNDEII